MMEQLKGLKANFVGGWKTTVGGGLLFVAGATTKFMEISSWLEATPVILIGLVLFCMKDPKKKQKR